ncbi:ImmA/IrrE family metallo-endopeptidase [Pseudoramibacter porci]|uniref:ImmA/IrrE family metallo-endopeptidase n=1 Tax=Pseudoramibacter porci TaxID=2606631 RepID=A0A7X2NFA5_9FIRM|nr:ImmA/IrrE family metallo-endopeptidase [Pseudoramibacter porci]MSS19355.1 ImmA/IrrE family metallo-endopeptidase [Pseudoramibacter porci]
MIDSSGIYRCAQHFIRQYGNRRLELIIQKLGIRLYEVPDLDELLGMYTVRWRHRIILINPSISEDLRRMVLAHELGHDQLHRDLAKGEALSENSLFDTVDHTEYEANAFAAHLLLDHDQVYELAQDGRDVVEMAKILRTDVNLVLIKLQEMTRLGWDLRVPLVPNARFFTNINCS